jgi:hypothetical protein
MTVETPPDAPRAPLSVYMLADHLDAALAAGEDLVARSHDWRTLAEDEGLETDFAFNQRAIVEEIRGLELMVIARVLKAREHSYTLAEIDARFAAVAKLFASGTALLLDAVEECGDARSDDFETGDGIVAYVRSRGLISPESPGVDKPSQLVIDDLFLVAKRMALGPLMDMAGAYLDALDAHYDLFLEYPVDELATASPAARAEFGRRERMPVN